MAQNLLDTGKCRPCLTFEAEIALAIVINEASPLREIRPWLNFHKSWET